MKNLSSLSFERQVAEQLYDTAASTRHHERLARATADSAAGWSRFRDAAGVKTVAGAIRAADIRRLDVLLEGFSARFEHAGGAVHWAPDAADARAVLAKILADSGVKRAVRGHSSTLGEIGADAVFAKAGVTLIQTAFGDYVNGLAGEPASHPVYPASHYTREHIAALLHRKGGEALCRTSEEITEALRRRVRPEFTGVDAGVIGANFLLADSGHVVIAENEGNLRLCAALPRVLIIVAGIDKVTSSADNLPVLLAALAAASSGRPLPPSVTLLRPDAPRLEPRPAGSRVHLILVDNGRTHRLSSTATADTLRCIGCGACSDVCPVYRLAGGAAFGMRRPGPYGLATELGDHDPMRRRQLAMATPLCGACSEVCPVHIDLHDALVAARAEPGHTLPGFRLRLILAAYLWSVRSHRRFALGAGLFKKLIILLDFVRDTPLNPVEAWSKHRTLPEAPNRSFRRWWKDTGGIQAPPPPSPKP